MLIFFNIFYIMWFFLFLFSVLFLIIFLLVINMKVSIFFQWDMYLFSSKVSFPIFVDDLSCLFMSLVLFISSFIILYSQFYMEGDLFKSRFFYLMMLFVISMIFLILCPNMIFMLIGWDGLGLVSYCLVIFYQNYKSLSAGMITALTNRVGDVFIIGSIGLFFSMGTWNYINLLEINKNGFYIMTLFILASMTKSAQIPFSSWLPSAMAAPTPVSSLVHSSTLVTAGIYILIRFFNFLNQNHFLNYLLIISLLTMVMAGISGCLDFDLKKIIAFSTLSQLGFMMCSLSLGLLTLTSFHLMTHACFKALMFMCAGVFIHNSFDNQDIRTFGLLSKNNCLILCFFNCSNLSLCGFPFLSGFFSKDSIIECFLMKNLNPLVLFLFFFGIFLTVFYSIRLFTFLTFRSFFSSSIEGNFKELKIHKSMILLYFLSLTLGFYLSKFWLIPMSCVVLPFFLKVFAFVSFFVSFFLSSMYSKTSIMLKLTNKSWLNFFTSMWFLYFFKTDLSKYMFLSLGFNLNKLSIGFIEYLFGHKNYFMFIHSSIYINNFLMNIFFKSMTVMFFMFCLYFMFF